ncbi:MAG: hypothetical protein IJ221_02275 [Oscillibacter sp.]|nr:hypothetical protein [Oscillibacter sp.]
MKKGGRRGPLLALLGMLALLSGCGGDRACWVEQCGDCQVELRRCAQAPEDLEVVLRTNDGETVVRTLPLAREENVSAQSFTDVLGWPGFLLTERQGLAEPDQDWSVRTYYAVEDGRARQIAVSFGWGEPEDYEVDLDADGEKELVSNVVYGGDGHHSAFIYKRRGDEVRQGRHTTADLPDFDQRNANSVAVTYDPEKNAFCIRYAVKGQSDPAEVETTGLEGVEFGP